MYDVIDLIKHAPIFKEIESDFKINDKDVSRYMEDTNYNRTIDINITQEEIDMFNSDDLKLLIIILKIFLKKNINYYYKKHVILK